MVLYFFHSNYVIFSYALIYVLIPILKLYALFYAQIIFEPLSMLELLSIFSTCVLATELLILKETTFFTIFNILEVSRTQIKIVFILINLLNNYISIIIKTNQANCGVRNNEGIVLTSLIN